MYPFKPGHIFVRDARYAGALSGEVGDTPFERRILDEPMLFRRTQAGRVVALRSLRPHRRLPLRLGKRSDDDGQCDCHGITVGADGRGVRVRSRTRLNEPVRLRSHPLLEREQSGERVAPRAVGA